MAPLRVLLLGALVLSAAAALFAQPQVVEAVRSGSLAAGWLLVAPGLFSIVVVVAALDAWRVAKKRGYFRGPSVVALAALVAFLGLLLPSTFSEYRARTSPPFDSKAYQQALWKSPDPRVRALVIEVTGLRATPNPEAAGMLALGLEDGDPLVVDAAVAAVAHRSGEALAGPAGRARAAELVKSWRQ